MVVLPPFFNICSFAESFGGFEPLSYRDASSPLCKFIDTKKGIKWVIYPERAQGVTVTESSFVIPLPPRKLDPLADSLAARLSRRPTAAPATTGDPPTASALPSVETDDSTN
jgi:hypothetical protein